MKLHPVAALRAFGHTLVSGPVPTFDELTVQFNRFISERAPLFPEEAVLLAGFITGLAKGIAPMLAQLGFAAATPPPPVSAPPPTESAAETLAPLLGIPTGEQLLLMMQRFFEKRAPHHPLEATAIFGALARILRAPQVAALLAVFEAAPSPDPDPTPCKPSSTDGEVN
jgi:hypothetical protein